MTVRRMSEGRAVCHCPGGDRQDHRGLQGSEKSGCRFAWIEALSSPGGLHKLAEDDSAGGDEPAAGADHNIPPVRPGGRLITYADSQQSQPQQLYDEGQNEVSSRSHSSLIL